MQYLPERYTNLMAKDILQYTKTEMKQMDMIEYMTTLSYVKAMFVAKYQLSSDKKGAKSDKSEETQYWGVDDRDPTFFSEV